MSQFKTFNFLNQEYLDREKPINVVCCGSSRGGTSAVSLVMRGIGLNMGENLHKLTHEDLDIERDVVENLPESLRSTIRKKGTTYAGWSVKQPFAIEYFDIFRDSLDNPLFCIVIRNMLHISRSLINRDERYASGCAESFANTLSHSLHFYNQLPKIISEGKTPIILVAYDDVINKPYLFIKEFSKVIHQPIGFFKALKIANLISKPGYKSLK